MCALYVVGGPRRAGPEQAAWGCCCEHSAHLQVQREFGYDELIEAHAFGFRFAG